jgi:hypothetical protein
MNFKIPKKCLCGYECWDSISGRHISSMAHNVALMKRRKEVQITTSKSTMGDCLICKVKNVRNLERHLLTNMHIRKEDSYLTHKFIAERLASQEIL